MADLKIKQFQLMPYNIKLKTPWQSASSRLFFRQGFLVKLIINESLFAIGECAPMEEIGTESLAQAQDFLDKKLPTLINKPIDFDLLSGMKLFPASRFALETALLSLIAQQEKTDITQLLNNVTLRPHKKKPIPVKINAMLGPINKDILSKAREEENKGFSCLKIKLGFDDIETEAKILDQLLQNTSADTRLKLDANKSWTQGETEWLLNFLKPYNNRIESIEEPLKDYDQSTYQMLQNSTAIALALDESFSKEIQNSLNKPSNKSIDLFKYYPVKQLILKPMAQGGIIETLKLVKQSQMSKIKTTITSSIESAHGLWPILQLCAIVNNEQFHGLATATWLEDTLIEPPEINHGIITYYP